MAKADDIVQTQSSLRSEALQEVLAGLMTGTFWNQNESVIEAWRNEIDAWNFAGLQVRKHFDDGLVVQHAAGNFGNVKHIRQPRKNDDKNNETVQDAVSAILSGKR